MARAFTLESLLLVSDAESESLTTVFNFTLGRTWKKVGGNAPKLPHTVNPCPQRVKTVT